MTDSPVDRDLEQMAGNPRLARAVKESLERLRSGAAGPDMAEMAKDVLDGRTDLRSVGRSSAYAGHIRDGIDKFNRWQADLSPEEREELDRKIREEFGDADQ